MYRLCQQWVMVFVLGTVLASQAEAAAACDRACLARLLDTYLNAVIKHDPGAAPLAGSYRATENAVAVPAGEGIWKTATGLGTVQRQYFDEVNGQGAYVGHLKEGEATDIVSVRIKVSDRQVTEAEWTIARKGYSGMFDADGLNTYPPPPAAILPTRQRTSRFQMQALANGYFQALQDHDGGLVPRVDHCERVENGVKVTFRRRADAPPGGPTAPAAPTGAPSLAQEEISGDCLADFAGFRNSIAETTLRRFPLIDEVQGVVMGMTIFRRPATSTMRRNLLTEYFYTREGKMAGIWAVMYYLDPDAPHASGWNN